MKVLQFTEKSKRRYIGIKQLMETKTMFHIVNLSTVQQTDLHSLRSGDRDILCAHVLVHCNIKSLQTGLEPVNCISVFRKLYAQVPKLYDFMVPYIERCNCHQSWQLRVWEWNLHWEVMQLQYQPFFFLIITSNIQNNCKLTQLLLRKYQTHVILYMLPVYRALMAF